MESSCLDARETIYYMNLLCFTWNAVIRLENKKSCDLIMF